MHWQYLALKGFSLFLCCLPYRVVRGIGSLIGVLHFTFGKSQRNRAIRQLKERLCLSETDAVETARKMFRQIGWTLVEILYLPAISQNQLQKLVTIENIHYLRNAHATGKGVVLLTAHYGNWEWMGARLALAGFPMAAIAQGQPNAGLDHLLNEYRQMCGMEPFARGSALSSAMKALRRGKVLGFLADQDAREEGIFVDFFGVKTSTPRGPALFSVRTDAPVVPAFIIRHGKGHRILLHPPINPDQMGHPDEETVLAVLTERMTRVMERRIKEYPDHWWWFQRRWLTSLPLKGGPER